MKLWVVFWLFVLVFMSFSCGPKLARSPVLGCKLPPEEMQLDDGSTVYAKCREVPELKKLVCVVGPAYRWQHATCYLVFTSDGCGPMQLEPKAECVADKLEASL